MSTVKPAPRYFGCTHCATYRSAYRALEALERDLMRHIHLENNVLFPAARALAEGTG
jgi:regulator of cell morphogenesis and NO signaling